MPCAYDNFMCAHNTCKSILCTSAPFIYILMGLFNAAPVRASHGIAVSNYMSFYKRGADKEGTSKNNVGGFRRSPIFIEKYSASKKEKQDSGKPCLATNFLM